MKTTTKVPLQAFLFIALLLVVLAGCNNQPGNKQSTDKTPGGDTSLQLLSETNMKEDLSILFTAFKDIHPAYGLYTPDDSMANLYHRIAGTLQQPMSEDEFMTAISPLVSALKCGHTQVKHSAGYKPYTGDKTFRLPFKVLVQDNKAWVTYHQAKALSTGDELLSVNNIPVAAIIQHGGDLYAMDGNNHTFKELFLSEYDGFEDACNKYYRWKPPYNIRIRTKDGSEKSVTVDTVSSKMPLAEQMKEIDNYDTWVVSRKTGYLPLRYLPNASVACFEVHTYQYEDTAIYQKAFREIHEKGIRNLIIDLRHNTGGDIRIAAKLVTYLADAPFQMVGDVWSRVPDPTKTPFERYFDHEISGSFSQSFKPRNIKTDGHYQVAFQPVFGDLMGNTKLASADHYTGNLFVLIDGATFSSGAHTAAAIKQHCRKAIFIGRETGGGSEGCSGGTTQHLTLPHTGIQVDFPLLRLVSVLKHPVKGRGILPDKTVHFTPADIVTHNDPDLKAAINMIDNSALLSGKSIH
ncbi:hypothetical protein HHL17_11020 [Chitinophaga sp. G-6-1-13]|uniref:Tail specific protease domain-containing protein n=1 Tax=Chitinophaga fulva TaxID=2728842 RepID=A0A848GGE9_9BACT|nr:S41 family peptidase [Chitinophaga fulva]NML37725.1 hypothetical protein [Chitinophaga fulva]